MNNLLRNKKLLIIAGVIILLLLLLFIVSGPKKPGSNNPDNPLTPTRGPSPTPAYNGLDVYEYVEPTLEPTFEDQEIKLRELTKQLPYRGDNFSIQYSFKTNEFTVGIANASKSQGLQELDKYLKGNGIRGTSAIRNLVIKYY